MLQLGAIRDVQVGEEWPSAVRFADCEDASDSTLSPGLLQPKRDRRSREMTCDGRSGGHRASNERSADAR